MKIIYYFKLLWFRGYTVVSINQYNTFIKYSFWENYIHLNNNPQMIQFLIVFGVIVKKLGSGS